MLNSKEDISIQYQKLSSKEILKLAKTKDNQLQQIYEIFKEHIFTFYGETSEEFIKSLVEQKNRIYLAKNKDEIIGCVIGNYRNFKFNLDYVIVKKKYQNKKIATKLLIRVLAENRVKGINNITISNPKPATENILNKITGKKDIMPGKKRGFNSNFKYECTKPFPEAYVIKILKTRKVK